MGTFVDILIIVLFVGSIALTPSHTVSTTSIPPDWKCTKSIVSSAPGELPVVEKCVQYMASVAGEINKNAKNH